MDEACGFAHNLALLRGKDAAAAFLRSALTALETYSEPAEEHQQPELPFELMEKTLGTLLPSVSLRRHGMTEAELVAILSATKQSLNHLLTAAAVCLQWRHAVSRAAGELKAQCAAIVCCFNYHSDVVVRSEYLRNESNLTLMPGLLALKTVTELSLRWFQEHGAGWELRNTLHVPDARFIARIGEFAIVAKIEEPRQEGSSHERVAKMLEVVGAAEAATPD